MDKMSAAKAEAAIARAKAYAGERKVPLTAERLAVELGVTVGQLKAFVQRAPEEMKGRRAKVHALLQEAFAEAVASVTEHAMTRGTGVNMHMLYLKQYGGYDSVDDKGDGQAVVFIGEQQI